MHYSYIMSSKQQPGIAISSSSSSSLPYDLSFTPLVEMLKSRNMNGGGEDSEWTHTLYARLDHIRSKCGAPCSINSLDAFYRYAVNGDNLNIAAAGTAAIPTGTAPSTEVRLEVPINCQEIFELEEIDASDMTFPAEPPEELIPLYTLGGSIPVVPKDILKVVYLDGTDKLVWTEDDIEAQMMAMESGELQGTYGAEETNKLRDFVLNKMSLSGKSVLVIGSEQPWVEVSALLAGAAKVTTLEYAEIESQHPKIDTYTPSKFRAAYLDGSLGEFDAILSHSSLEHSGLGRYGDALNPWGDVLSLARAWCVTKDNGQMMLGVPTCSTDAVLWNIHRCYGSLRWPLITMNWVKTDGNEYSYEADGNGGMIGVLHAFRKVS